MPDLYRQMELEGSQAGLPGQGPQYHAEHSVQSQVEMAETAHLNHPKVHCCRGDDFAFHRSLSALHYLGNQMLVAGHAQQILVFQLVLGEISAG